MLLLLSILVLLAPVTALALDCEVYHEAIIQCAKDGCDTTIDDFAECLVEEQGITDEAADGTDELSELIECFQTQYECQE